VELDAFILADAATVVGDKFFVHGGGMTVYEVPGLPCPIPLSVLIRFLLKEGDFDKEHRLELTLRGQTGLPNIDPVEITALQQAPLPSAVVDGQQQFLQIALGLPAVAVREGLYKVEMRVDGKLRKTAPFPVVVNPNLLMVSPGAVEPQSRSRPKAKAKKPPPPPRKQRRR
jgi:hypothetical protein